MYDGDADVINHKSKFLNRYILNQTCYAIIQYPQLAHPYQLVCGLYGDFVCDGREP
jgi:hypothetical protein